VVNVFMAANPFTTASQLKDVIKRITTISLSDEMTRLAIHKAGFTRKTTSLLCSTKTSRGSHSRFP